MTSSTKDQMTPDECIYESLLRESLAQLRRLANAANDVLKQWDEQADEIPTLLHAGLLEPHIEHLRTILHGESTSCPD